MIIRRIVITRRFHYTSLELFAIVRVNGLTRSSAIYTLVSIHSIRHPTPPTQQNVNINLGLKFPTTNWINTGVQSYSSYYLDIMHFRTPKDAFGRLRTYMPKAYTSSVVE